MVSPVEGEIVEVNPEVVKHPSLLRQDPYGQGWLMTVYVPDEQSVERNFLPVHLAKAWVRDCAERLFAKHLIAALREDADRRDGRHVDLLQGAHVIEYREARA